MPYTIESEYKTTERRGPFGVFKKEVVSIIPLGELNEGEERVLFSFSRGERWGLARLQNDYLQVTPESGVVVDYGDITGFKGYREAIKKGPKKGSEISIRIRTQQDLTIRKPDNPESLHLRRKIIS